MILHKITELYTELFSVYHNITLKFSTIAIFKTASHKTMIQIKLIGMSMISYYTKVHLSKCNGSWVVSTERTMNFNIQTTAMFVYFVLDKNGLIKSYSTFEALSVYKISWSHLDWCKFCIHLRSLNVRHFGVVEGTGLKSTASRSPSMAWTGKQRDRETHRLSHEPHFPFLRKVG
jgi:hypothetical protein